jgi:hypothetical protein
MFSKESSLMNHQLQNKRVVFEFAITANAVPASKKVESDIPGVALVVTQGLTAAAVAIEPTILAQITTPVDATGSFSILVKLPLEKEKAKKVYKVTLTEKTAFSSANTITLVNSATGITTDKNIAFSVVATGVDLTTESPRYLCEIEYLELD